MEVEKRVLTLKKSNDTLYMIDSADGHEIFPYILTKEWVDKYTEPYEEAGNTDKYRIGDVFSTGFSRYVITAIEGNDIYIVYRDGFCGTTTIERIEEDDCYIGHMDLNLFVTEMENIE